MARCGCAGTTCSCLLQGGDWIEVSGSGTIDDPYIISSTGVDVSDSISFNDSATVNFTVTGAGTSTNPFEVSAAAEVSVNELTDVNCSGPTNGQTIIWNSSASEWRCGKPPYALNDLTDVTAPNPEANQVLAWNGTAWVPAPPVTAEPGAIVTGTSISGDGTTANPLEINIVTDDPQFQLLGAGTDADPLTSSLYGGTFNDVSWTPDIDISEYPLGISRIYITGNGVAAGWPSNYGNIVTIRTTTSNAWQWYYPYSASQPPRLRAYSAGTAGWQRWLNGPSPRGVQEVAGGAVTVPGKTTEFATLTVTFPNNLFTHNPGVFLSLRGGKPNITYAIDNVSPESFDIVVDRPSGEDSDMFWVAISNYTNLE